MVFYNAHTHFSNQPDYEIFQGNLEEDCVFFYSAGLHPWQAERYDDRIEKKMIQNWSNPKCLAVGEIGLDKLKGPSLDIQQEIFSKQIEFSEKMELPVILHCVKAWNELRSIKKKMQPKQQWVFHGFSKIGILQEVLTEEIMISIGSTILTHPKKEELINGIPFHRLLLETDDSAIDLKEIYKTVAELKKISLQQLAELIEQNFQNTFTKWHIG